MSLNGRLCGTMLMLLLFSVAVVEAGPISAGFDHTLGVRADGSVVGWGSNSYGKVTGGGGVSNAVSVSAGDYHSVALRSNGTVAAWGLNNYGQVSGAASVSNATAVAAGAYHSLALRSNGTVAAWGQNNYGQRSGANSVSNATAVAAGEYHSIALRSDGTVAAWGYNGGGLVSQAGSVQGATAIAAGEYHSLALRGDGTVAAWGINNGSSVTGASSVTNAVAIAAGSRHSLALRSNGTIAAWGDNSYGVVSTAGGLNDIVFVSAGDFHDYAVRSDGSIVSWGNSGNGRRSTPGSLQLPTIARWSKAADGDYLNSHMWDGGIPSTALSDARFDQAGTYGINFGNSARARNLDVTAGDVYFALGPHTYHVQNGVGISGSNTVFRTNGAINAGSISNSAAIRIGNGGSLSANSITNTGTIYNDGSISGNVVTQNGGMLTGSGSTSGTTTIGNGGTLSPGNSPGTMAMAGIVNWNEGGTYLWEINDAQGIAGSDPGWDLLSIDGDLSINANSADPFYIDITSLDLSNTAGMAANFDDSLNYNWTIASFTGSLFGFDESSFFLDTSGFANPFTGTFGIENVGNLINVTYTAAATGPASSVPEPTSLALLVSGAVGLLAYRRRQTDSDDCATV